MRFYRNNVDGMAAVHPLRWTSLRYFDVAYNIRTGTGASVLAVVASIGRVLGRPLVAQLGPARPAIRLGSSPTALELVSHLDGSPAPASTTSSPTYGPRGPIIARRPTLHESAHMPREATTMTLAHDSSRRRFLVTLAAGAGCGMGIAWLADRSLASPADADQRAPARSGSPARNGFDPTQPYPKDWFAHARYGLMHHFSGNEGPGWNDHVDAFDVDAFASDAARAGAGYVLFMLGQNSGYYCTPNAAYDGFTGYAAGERCARRDLPMDLADALAERGIPLMLYLPSRAPQGDAQARAGLGDVTSESEPAVQEFTRRWSAVIEEWASRYGRRVRGWWFDGAYNTLGWTDLSKPYNFSTWAAAARAGNPDRILAFNLGVIPQVAFVRLSHEQDYTAGEQNSFTATPAKNPPSTGLIWHALTFIGPHWGSAGAPRISDDELISWVQQVNGQGGVVTLDVAASDGRIHEPHLRQLEALAAAEPVGPPTSTTTISPAPTAAQGPAVAVPRVATFTG